MKRYLPNVALCLRVLDQMTPDYGRGHVRSFVFIDAFNEHTAIF